MLAVWLAGAVLGQDCSTFSNRLGINFDFSVATEITNNLGGYPGGAAVGCTQGALDGGSDGACGYGCGCATPENVAPPGTVHEIRMQGAGTVRSLTPCHLRRAVVRC